MKIYVVSLAAGLLVGVIYSLLNVRSPAPPAIALVGLLGILIGEQAVPLLRQALGAAPEVAGVQRSAAHVFGLLPGHGHGGGGTAAANITGPGTPNQGDRT